MGAILPLMRSFPLGHIADGIRPVALPFGGWVTLAIVGVAVLLGLEHLVVKHGFGDLGRRLRVGCAAIVTVALSAVVAAPAGAAQFPEPLAGLPDLVSDAPFIWFQKNIETPDGEVRKVLAFDGFLHNIGEGMLDVFGNPQIPGDVKQRVFNGERWEEVGSPTVRYETDDGHSHYHLIAAAEYALWNDARTSELDPGSKVGFCLIDTEQMEDRLEAFYEIDRFDYCNVDDPDATELRMGLTPGWRDTYEANTTLQWVDVSRVAPGRYWVTSTMDPNNEIVESNEDNNGLVFSVNKFSLSGYRARELSVQEPDASIELKANTYGTVGDLAFVVVDAPTSGRLDVPAGVDLFESNVTYFADPGFVGTDTFSYYAHDIDDMFPLNPEIVTVTVTVDGAQDSEVPPPDAGVEMPTIVWPTEPVEAVRHDPFSLTFQSDNDAAHPVTWYAGGLPPGLRIDRETGEVNGVPSTPGTFESAIAVVADNSEMRRTVAWRVPSFGRRPPLPPLNDFSTSTGEEVRRFFGDVDDTSTYEGSGLPPGTFAVPSRPLLVGTPGEIGEFPVEIRLITDGETKEVINFVWTVRPAAVVAFAL